MAKKLTLAGLLILALGLFLSACGQKAAQSESPDEILPVVTQAEDAVVAEGVVEPARWVELHFDVAGEVTEVLVSEGDRVAADAPLLRLDTEELELSLRSAQQDVVAQKAALAQLVKGAREEVIARADKENADQIARAEVALQAVQLQLQRARLEDPTSEVAAAQATVKQLQRQLAQARTRDPAPDITAAQVGLERAQIALDDTQDEYDKALDRPWEDQRLRDEWTKRLEQAQLDYRLAQAQLDGAGKAQRAHLLNLEALAAQVEGAEAQLAQALTAASTYTTTLEVLAADVEAARVDLEALRTWDNPYLDEASQEEIAQAEVLVRKAEIAVDRLALQMEDAELRAPQSLELLGSDRASSAWTVVEVGVEVGDQVSPGQIVLVLATLDQLEVHTTDLTELDVGRVALGQPVEISVDALPGRTYPGSVREIGLRGQDYRGDVVYQVTVELTDPEEVQALRWGMTAVVTIQAP